MCWRNGVSCFVEYSTSWCRLIAPPGGIYLVFLSPVFPRGWELKSKSCRSPFLPFWLARLLFFLVGTSPRWYATHLTATHLVTSLLKSCYNWPMDLEDDRLIPLLQGAAKRPSVEIVWISNLIRSCKMNVLNAIVAFIGWNHSEWKLFFLIY